MTVHTYFESPQDTLQADAQKEFIVVTERCPEGGKLFLNPTRVWKMSLSLWKTFEFNQILALVLKIGDLNECQSNQ